MTHLEGRESVLAALEARRRRFQIVLIRHDAPDVRTKAVVELCEQLGVPTRITDAAELNALAHSPSHGGVIAICSEKPRWSAGALLEHLQRKSGPALLLLLEGVDDARNLGFTIRTAESLGVDAIMVKKHLWDFDEPDVARSASGAYERLPLVQFEGVDLLRDLQKLGIKLTGCLAGVRTAVYDADLAVPICLAIGGEKRGLSGAVRDICDQFVTIPSVGGASSLSLSHAGAIVLSEAFRQRRPLRPPSIEP
jgi:23S rRNA (guanosine2251-2'-O)-methyltransferase